MKHIYYKNDFAVEITLQDADGKAIAPPEWEWSVEFTDGRRKYVCSLANGNVNVVDGKIVCYLDAHKFCCGEISYKFVQAIPDLNYLDGFQDLVTPKALPLELWDKESDDADPIESSVVPAYVVYDAYMTAKAKGYQGTAEEYYKLLLDVGGYGEAEAQRVANEKQRVANEAGRQSGFKAMQSSVATATAEAKEASANALEAADLATDATNQAKQATTDARTATDKALASASGADKATAGANTATAKAVTATERANAISADLEAKKEADYWRGEKGDKGDKGEKGDNGVSPTVTTSKTGDTSVIEITDAKGTHQVEVKDGKSVDAYTKAETDEALATKQNVLTAGVGIAIEGDVVSAREEVLYDDYFYPNKQPTTDTVRFTDSYEVLQPTAYVGDYTDADGVQWQNVWECEGFPDWFDYSDKNCYPPGNGIGTGGVVLKTYTLNDAGELTYNLYLNKAAGRESLCNGVDVGIKKIDDTHFTLYRRKGRTLDYLTNFNVTYAEPDTWCICNQCFYVAYDLTECKRLRIEISGQTQFPSQYSSLLTTEGANAQMLRGFVQTQVVYGTIANVFEFNDDKSKYRVLRSTDSLYYRTSVTGAITYAGGDYVMNSKWIDIPKWSSYIRFYYNIINGEKRVFFGTNYLYNPALNLYHNCRVKITKLE